MTDNISQGGPPPGGPFANPGSDVTAAGPMVPANLADATTEQVRALIITYLRHSAAGLADELMGVVGPVLHAKDAALARALHQQ